MRTEEKTSKKAKVDPEDRVFPVYGLSGEPVEEFVAVDGPKGTAARDNAQNKIALDAPRLLKTTEQRALNGDFAIENLATFQRKFQTLTAGTFTSFTAVDWANIVVAGSAEIKFRSFVGLHFLFSDRLCRRSKLIIRRRDKKILNFFGFFLHF